MVAPPPTTAELAPDPMALCAHINRLTREIRLARRLLRVTIEARQEDATGKDISGAKP